MYTFEPPILYSDDALRGACLRSVPKLFSLFVTLSRPVPLGFCFGGFSSTAGYVPGNEARVRGLERRSTHLADHFQRALLVFIRATQICLAADPSKPFGFGSERTRQRHSAPSARERRVTASAPPLGAGQNHRSDLDCETILHPIFPKSSRKYFNYCPYFIGVLCISCG